MLTSVTTPTDGGKLRTSTRNRAAPGSSSITGWRHRSRGKGTAPELLRLTHHEKGHEMATCDDRYASNVPVTSGQKPRMTATAFSFSRQVIPSSVNSIHGNYLARHTAIGFPHRMTSVIRSNALLWILVPRPRDKHELLVLKYPARRVVRYGRKQYRGAPASPSGLLSNFFPFDTGSPGQWRGRRRHAPARLVPRIV